MRAVVWWRHLYQDIWAPKNLGLIKTSFVVSYYWQRATWIHMPIHSNPRPRPGLKCFALIRILTSRLPLKYLQSSLVPHPSSIFLVSVVFFSSFLPLAQSTTM